MKKRTHKDLLEFALKSQRRFDALGLEVFVIVSTYIIGEYSPNSYIVIKTIKDKSLHFSEQEIASLTFEDMLQKVKAELEPKFIQIDKICLDIFKTELYLQKETPVKVVQITEDGLLLSNGMEVQKEDLYYKEFSYEPSKK